jgi:hypothetical protein
LTASDYRSVHTFGTPSLKLITCDLFCATKKTFQSCFAEVAMPLPGLPDGLFSNPKSQFGKFWRVLDRKMFIYILWPFVIFYGDLGYFMTI